MNIEITDNQIIDNSLNKYLNKLKTMGILDPSCDDAQVCHIKNILFSFERNQYSESILTHLQTSDKSMDRFRSLEYISTQNIHLYGRSTNI